MKTHASHGHVIFTSQAFALFNRPLLGRPIFSNWQKIAQLPRAISQNLTRGIGEIVNRVLPGRMNGYTLCPSLLPCCLRRRSLDLALGHLGPHVIWFEYSVQGGVKRRDVTVTASRLFRIRSIRRRAPSKFARPYQLASTLQTSHCQSPQQIHLR
jgi:hypothetical protein